MVEADPLVRVRLDISYDGTDFSGWAVQPGRRTVQAELQSALSTVLRVPSLGLTVAGRTDAGVHAVGQVAHVDLPAAVWSQAQPRLVHKLAGRLDPDVRVVAASAVPADFDARFSALWRRYEYRLCDREAGVQPLRRRYVMAWRHELDVDAMAEAAQLLLGLHDYVGFCRVRATATTIRTLERFDVSREADEIVCTVQADAFCHSMVRSLVGALIAVGEHRRTIGWPAQLLERDRRADDVAVAAARGLTLVAVGYPADDQLAARAALTRTRRERSP